VSDIKTVEEIAMKKPKTVADLLAVADICIEASEARGQLLESRDRGASKKKQEQSGGQHNQLGRSRIPRGSLRSWISRELPAAILRSEGEEIVPSPCRCREVV
jgi:hypothetical protein